MLKCRMIGILAAVIIGASLVTTIVALTVEETLTEAQPEVMDTEKNLTEVLYPIHGCVNHNDCGSNLACVGRTCVDPCVDHCGPNTNCQVYKHDPSCSCPTNYTGNPDLFCSEIETLTEAQPEVMDTEKNLTEVLYPIHDGKDYDTISREINHDDYLHPAHLDVKPQRYYGGQGGSSSNGNSQQNFFNGGISGSLHFGDVHHNHGNVNNNGANGAGSCQEATLGENEVCDRGLCMCIPGASGDCVRGCIKYRHTFAGNHNEGGSHNFFQNNPALGGVWGRR